MHLCGKLPSLQSSISDRTHLDASSLLKSIPVILASKDGCFLMNFLFQIMYRSIWTTKKKKGGKKCKKLQILQINLPTVASDLCIVFCDCP